MLNQTLLKESDLSTNNNKEALKELPYYIVILRNENKKMKIPCSNETVAKKVLAGFTKLVQPSQLQLQNPSHVK